LKATPCSTERYTYKFEGQPSALTVFQPEVIKRSNRNQPAPQLSRILRPRRFVCRKCKKAYHVEEGNGVEMSSAALSLQIERHNQDGLVATPPIIPKLNDDYGLSGRESEADSNSDDAVVVRRKKVTERTTTNDETSVTTVKPVIPAKRKAESASKPSRAKKVKRATPDPLGSLAVSVAETNCSENSSIGSVTSVKISINPDVPEAQVTSEDVSPTTDLKPQLTTQCMESSQVSQKHDDPVVRKNRIKAQYVSVATPFRFPPSRSSKPNLFANNPFGFGSREKSTTPKRVRTTDSSPKKGKSDTEVRSPNSPRKTAMVNDASGVKKQPSDNNPVRSRTRGRSTQLTALNSNSESCASTTKCSVLSNSCPPLDSLENTAPLNVDEAPGSDANVCATEIVKCDPTGDSSAGSVPCSQAKTIPPINQVSQATDHASTQLPNLTDGTNGRSKSMDYEKPKNRWIREARARRSQEERGLGLMVNNPNTTALSLPASSATEILGSSSTGMSSPTLSRLRVRSGDGSLTSPSVSANVSPKTPSSAKKKGGGNLTAVPEGGVASPDDEMAKSIVSSSACSPRGAPLSSDNSNASLPVLKIKINRQRQPSCSSSTSAQYEVVELQVPDLEGLPAAKSHVQDPIGSTASSAATDVSSENIESKVSTFCNGGPPLTGGASPTFSTSSSRKCFGSTEAPGLGRLVKRCQLPDGVVFRVGDLVWSKLSGWPYWPAQITSIHQSVDGGEQELGSDICAQQADTKSMSFTACLHWFAWHQVSYMACDKLYHFMQHYKRFDNKKKRGVFRQAVNEARQAADNKQDTTSSLSDSESSEDGDTARIVSNDPIVGIHLSPCAPNPTSDLSGFAQEERADVSVPSNVDHVPEQKTIPATVADLSQVVVSSVQTSATPVKRNLSSGPGRRGGSRGRSRSLRGRRGGLAGSCDRAHSSTRSMPSFLSPSENNVKTPYDQFDEMDAIQAPLPFRRKNARGRGTYTKTTGNNPSVFGLSGKDVTLGVAPAPPTSTGSLKIKLSTAHLRLPVVKKRQSTKPKVSKKRVKAKPEDGSIVPMVESAISDSAVVAGALNKSSIPPNSDNSGPNPGDLSATFVPNYDDPSEAILSQFPHVFPDLRPGILSDAVEIPTFSEDESEEENTGRLIIDPEVMAAVNVSNALPTVANQSVVSRGKSNNVMLDETLYNTSYFHSIQQSATSARPELDPLYASGVSNLIDPHGSRPPETVFGDKPSLPSSVTAPAHPAP
uniref:PWWP domain-containing protein n=1 Tax=Echinostoma caproni TaxID=27848 RepID=A0A183BD11_9TREM